MNPLTNVRNLQKINDRELQMGLTGHEKSWHSKYKNSAWIYFGGVSFDLTEGDLLCIFSQYGEIVNINLVRDKETGKSRGFGFICYEDQRSTILAIDNFNGAKICNRTFRVDHVENYKPPKDSDEYDELTKMLHEKGCAPEVMREQGKPQGSGASQSDKSGDEDDEDSAGRKERKKEKKRAKKAAKKLKKEQKRKLKALKKEIKKRFKEAPSSSSDSSSASASPKSTTKLPETKEERSDRMKIDRPEREIATDHRNRSRSPVHRSSHRSPNRSARGPRNSSRSRSPPKRDGRVNRRSESPRDRHHSYGSGDRSRYRSSESRKR
ncbi:RNA-binding motif protein, X-linked 2 [Galendromus occidentalis]|uniref:RNA-binding motif protein, X-linked 2 n=1 Tax=Galendromus occidentalis TaxID=34638 RepID=A0AAJ6QU53_9ACAR|nr:RNA-binding motif protein, X-linked 2 [Galendromus occidentalis]